MHEALAVTRGSRDLSQEELALIKKIRMHGDVLSALIDEVRDLHMREIEVNGTGSLDTPQMREINHLVREGQRWRGRATDSLQDGLTQLMRSVDRRYSFA